jgi:predicted NAD-dependent protein-ADP-ribosyltransferase YbiA (DUF1768 family)
LEDFFWGICDGKGKPLRKILMEVRKELKGDGLENILFKK